MEALRKPVGMHLAALAVAVAAYFVINPFLVKSFDVIDRMECAGRSDGDRAGTGPDF